MESAEETPREKMALPVKIQLPDAESSRLKATEIDPLKPEVPEVGDDWSVFDSWPKISSAMGFALSGVFALGVGLLALFLNSSRAWPSTDEIVSSVKKPPVYEPTNMKPFVLERGGYKWTLVPRHTLELHCLVLSERSPSRWIQVGEPGRFKLISADITGTWGKNAEMGYYRRGQFGNTSEAEYAHNTYASWNSSEHKYFSLIASNRDVDRAIRQIKTGDQCKISGVTATYSRNQDGGGEKGVSHDVVYVIGVEFLHKHNHFKRLLATSLFSTGAVLLGISLFIKIFPPKEDE